MSCDQLPVLYQNRRCHQEDVDEIVFDDNNGSIKEGLDLLSFFKIKTTSLSKRENKLFKIGSNTYWTHLSDMIECIFNHFLINMSNKLLVIGGQSSITLKVFDSVNRNFSYIKNKTFSSFLSAKQKTKLVKINYNREIIFYFIILY